MKLSESHYRAIEKLAPLNERLDRQFGVTLDLTSDEEHLRNVFEHYCRKRQFLLAKEGQEALNDPTYAKSVLISETIRLLLREIAPKRLRKKRNK